jgi:two-component system, chemotaxis family, chemotaxis protein CheY
MAEYSVLIIDDDVWMQRILSKTLQSYGFKKAILASNGFDGIAKAADFRPSLIILDILMPELSGHLTLKVLKALKTVKDIPVIMVSALSDVENLGRAVKSGTAGFISKPFTRATVYEKLLDLYGKEKLDLIQKGMDISEGSNLGYYDESVFGQLAPGADSDDSSEGALGGFQMPQFGEPSSPDKLNQSYKEDDKSSLDSIKDMLNKGKK